MGIRTFEVLPTSSDCSQGHDTGSGGVREHHGAPSYGGMVSCSGVGEGWLAASRANDGS